MARTKSTAVLKDERYEKALFRDIVALIEQSRRSAASVVNSEMVLLYWNIGLRIRRNILGNERAEYGKQIIASLSDHLVKQYGEGFGRRNLFSMVRFAEVFPHSNIVQTLSAQLAWSHILEILSLDDELKRDFYIEMCRMERWSVRQLRERINGMLYERTAISKKPATLVKKELRALRREDKLSSDLVFRDQYLLDFLGLKEVYTEKDLESAILVELQRFITELGTDFAFLSRQKRITIDREDYYIDLLFYHRRLHRLVAIDLKLGKFRPADKAQMELYLGWLQRYEQDEKEDSPLGLILCADKCDEHVELLMLNRGNIRVAQYWDGTSVERVFSEKAPQSP